MGKKTSKILIGSFVSVFVFCICVFIFLLGSTSRINAQMVNKVGDFYMTRISVQIKRHFQTTMDAKLSQINTLIDRTPPDGEIQGHELIEELTRSGMIRKFDGLAFLTDDEQLHMIYGDQFMPIDLTNFMASIRAGEKKTTLVRQENSDGIEVLIGVPCEYTLENGEKSIAIAAGISIDYIRETLAVSNADEDTYSFISMKDGTLLMKTEETQEENFFDWLGNVVVMSDGKDAEYFQSGLKKAMDEGGIFNDTINTEKCLRSIVATPLAYSEWYLITIMEYTTLDDIVSSHEGARTAYYVLSMALLFIIFLALFVFYYNFTKKQFVLLNEARDEAVSANKAKSEFLSNMSHDIRTPMNAIVGMTAIATANIDDKQQLTNCLKKITLSSRHLLGLINDILDMSKIESGKMTLNVELISLRETMDSIVSIIQPQVKLKNQQFDIFISNIISEDVYCDSVRLNQVLINFLSNAFKFTPEGGMIHMSVSQESSPKGDKYVRVHFRVKDSGIGMTPEFKEKIFEAFVREDNLRVHKTEGTGLGMAITKHIIDAMEGTIEINSEPNKGTEFHVTLDLEKATVKEADMVLPEWNMLLVDDDEQLCRDTAASLREMTVKCDWALGGRQAIKMVGEHFEKHNDYQIILLDWKMGDMDGIATARELRRVYGSELPILLISAYDWSDIEEEAREAGISGFISKPLFKSTLFHGLMQFMDPIQYREEEKKAKQRDFTGVRVLLAEDNDLNYEIANDLLADIGIQTEWAENGQICVEMFEKSEEGYYDAVLMDIRMPVMSGYEAAAKIRAMTDRADVHIPIIAMTADAFSEDVKKCLEYGMDAHISKPIDMSVVTKMLAKYLPDRENAE